ncbi:MAG: hypothetical protein JNK58_02475 [Phycisphaerae bacterium]|nr:hypothetical protein [Phycisphaerae bacterium]
MPLTPPTTAARRIAIAAPILIVGVAAAAIFNMTLRDFHLPGTQVGDITPGTIQPSTNCAVCHANYDPDSEPGFAWKGSLMAQAGRDPLFYAQMTTANQDVANAGYFCLRCHVPNSFVTGHAYQPDGSTLDSLDLDGVNCHFCHSMVDPVYSDATSPPEDLDILAAMSEVPMHYGNSMFVLDPTGTRRGPRADHEAVHPVIPSPFFRSGDMCGTCHDVGNVATTRQPDGTYRYNALDQPPPSDDLAHMFPLERTYTEWKLSDFANGGVDMGGRFGGDGPTVVSTCQDCHMPVVTGRACFFGPERHDMKRHDFAGASAQVLDIIAEFTRDDPNVDQAAIAAGKAKAVSMLERAATLQATTHGTSLRVRVINESGHKLPTGHIEGRRVWVNVRYFNKRGGLIHEHGHYDHDEAELDETSTTIFEMHVGLSEAAAAATGLPPGPTGRMALADTIVKDNRIPPRGWSNVLYELGGAPAVGANYPDGQYWADIDYPIPASAVRAEIRLYYQNTPRHYIEMLRDNNHTDHWGQTLHGLWTSTGRGAPILMAQIEAPIIRPPLSPGLARAEVWSDIVDILRDFGRCAPPGDARDYTQDGVLDFADLTAALAELGRE